MKKIILLTVLLIASVSYSQNRSDREMVNIEKKQIEKAVEIQSGFPFGVNYSITEVEGAYDHLKQILRKNKAISIVAEVDHAENAGSVGEELNYSRIIFFGNPKLGTPLMQKNQLAGMDLPQKVLFYQDAEKKNILLYNNVNYLRSRHGLDGVEALDKISGALEKLVQGVTKNSILKGEKNIIGFKEGIVTKESKLNFKDTYTKLKNALEANPGIRIMADLDHQKNAAGVDMELGPTRIIIFGNPNLGTPLMQEVQSIGLDLPQKMLVWENSAGEVFVSYNDPYFIAKRHSVENKKEVLDKISGALSKLAKNATGN